MDNLINNIFVTLFEGAGGYKITHNEVTVVINRLYIENKKIVFRLVDEMRLGRVYQDIPFYLWEVLILKAINEKDVKLAFHIYKKIQNADEIDMKYWFDYKRHEYKLEPLITAGRLLEE